jgi:hypothetical protein
VLFIGTPTAELPLVAFPKATSSWTGLSKSQFDSNSNGSLSDSELTVMYDGLTAEIAAVTIGPATHEEVLNSVFSQTPREAALDDAKKAGIAAYKVSQNFEDFRNAATVKLAEFAKSELLKDAPADLYPERIWYELTRDGVPVTTIGFFHPAYEHQPKHQSEEVMRLYHEGASDHTLLEAVGKVIGQTLSPERFYLTETDTWKLTLSERFDATKASHVLPALERFKKAIASEKRGLAEQEAQRAETLAAEKAKIEADRREDRYSDDVESYEP